MKLSRRGFIKALAFAGIISTIPVDLWAREEYFQRIDGAISIYNTHTGESTSVTYRNSDGLYDPSALREINYIMRCPYTNEETEMDVALVELLTNIDWLFGEGNTLHLISGYRSPEYNELLHRGGHGVVRNSLHLKGAAADIRIPRVSTKDLFNLSKSLRKGGVGHYPSADFVHVDTGRVRYWHG